MEISYFLPLISGCILTLLFLLCKLIIYKRYKEGIDTRLWLIPILLMFLPSPIIAKSLEPITDAMPPISRMAEPYLQHIQNSPVSLGIKNIFLIAWISIVFALFIAIIIIQLVFWKRQSNATKITNQVQNILAEAKQFIGINREIDVYELEDIKSPVLIGVFHRKILFPKNFDWINQTSYITFILRHELAHCKRNDNLLKLILLILNVLMWWNPFVYIIRKNIEESCEYACDRSATKGMSNKDRLSYNKMLLAMSEKSMTLGSLASAFTSNNKLIRRFEVVMRKSRTNILSVTLALSVISIGTVATVFALNAEEKNADTGLISRVINQQKYDEACMNTYSYTVNDVSFNKTSGKYELIFEGVPIVEYDVDPISWQIEEIKTHGIELEQNVEDYVFITQK